MRAVEPYPAGSLLASAACCHVSFCGLQILLARHVNAPHPNKQAMEASAIKVQLQDLMLKREELEGDVARRSERLTAAGVGLRGSLCDDEV